MYTINRTSGYGNEEGTGKLAYNDEATYYTRNVETHTSVLEGEMSRMGYCNVVGSNDPMLL